MKHVFPTIVLALLYLGPSMIGIVSNRLDPSLPSGLAIAYLAAAGVLMGVLATGVTALLSLQWSFFKPNYLIVAPVVS